MSVVGDEPGSVRFVIVAARRTGSNFLCSLLDSHPGILCHHEIFNPKGIFYSLGLRGTDFALGSIAEREVDPLAFLDRVWSHPQGHHSLGFKMTQGQDTAVLARMLADSTVRKIVLERRNRVKTFLSESVAERLDLWEVYDEAQLIQERPRLVIDVEALRRHAARNQTFYREIDAALADAGQECLRTCYEDLGDPRERQRLLRFLDVMPEDVELRPQSVKQNSRDAREIVANFDELTNALRGDPLLGELLDLAD